MRARHGMARWAWAAFGALGLGTLAFTQNISYQPIPGPTASPYAPIDGSSPQAAPKPAPAASAKPAPKVHRDFTKDETKSRLVELQIELAWLADPLTFPCLLDAHVDRCLIEITGTVPNVAAHARAIELASEIGDRSLVDALTVKAMPAPEKTAQEAPAHLQVDALHALQESLPKLTHDLRLQPFPDGHVVVTGTIPSHEDKLLVSQRLRGVKGCTCVENRMQVWGIEDKGRRYCKVTVDGRLRVPAEASAPPPLRELPKDPASATQTATARPAFVPPPAAFEGHLTVRPPLFERIRTHDTMNPPNAASTAVAQGATPTSLPPTLPAPADPKKPTSPAPSVADAKKPTATVADAKTPTAVAADMKKSTPVVAAAKKPASIAGEVKKPTPAVVKTKKDEPVMPAQNPVVSAYGLLEPSEKKTASTRTVVNVTVPATAMNSMPEGPVQPSKTAPKKPTLASAVPVAPVGAACPKPVSGRVVKSATPLPTGSQTPKEQAPSKPLFRIVGLGATPAAPKPANGPSAPAIKQADLREAADKKPSPTLVQAGTHTTEQATAGLAKPDAALAERYRKRIQAECGRAARHVDVSFPDAKSIKVVVAVADARGAGPLSEKVWRIPELAAYRILIEVMVEKK